MNYHQYSIVLQPTDMEMQEVLIAHLSDAGFEVFEETNSGFHAFINSNEVNNLLHEKVSNLQQLVPFEYTILEIPHQNWNKKWEENFEPVVIAKKIFVRADFHLQNENYDYEIIIQPEMSFGTGHHETTSLVMELMLDVEFTNKVVCDMGCGTGILAVLAEKLGAIQVEAYDNDIQCILNTNDNISRNNCKVIMAARGDATVLQNKLYDVFIANINRNIILRDLQDYCSCIKSNGVFVCSGFYLNDLKIIEEHASKFNFALKHYLGRNNWAAAVFTSSSSL